MRGRADGQTQWIHTGMARHLGQATGLHREQSLRKCSPFEAELRRRLWWQIVVLDQHAGRILGVSTRDIPAPYMTDTKRPVNINDSELYPEMKEPPISRNCPTEMIFCAVRHEVGFCITQLHLDSGPSSQPQTVDEIKTEAHWELTRGLSIHVASDPALPIPRPNTTASKESKRSNRLSKLFSPGTWRKKAT